MENVRMSNIKIDQFGNVVVPRDKAGLDALAKEIYKSMGLEPAAPINYDRLNNKSRNRMLESLRKAKEDSQKARLPR